MSSSDAGAAAFNPTVLANGEPLDIRPPRTSAQQECLDAVADDSERAVQVIKEKIAGMQESLKAATATAKQARAAAQSEGN